MKETDVYDVLIAGGGPAGAAAAYTAARAGLSVLLTDKAEFPRDKLCGGLMTWKTSNCIGKVFDIGREQLLKDEIINYSTGKYEIWYLKKVLIRGEYPIPFDFTVRRKLDVALLGKARQAGVEVLENTAVEACEPDEGYILTEYGRKIFGRVLIGADGAHSRMRKSGGLQPKGWMRQTASTVEAHVDPGLMPQEYDRPVLVAGFVRAGYGWIFPNKDRYVVGLLDLPGTGSNLVRRFREFLDFVGYTGKGNEAAENVVLKGHHLPYGNYLRSPGRGKLLLAGDAGGLVEPLFGEGMYYAVRSGAAAGAAAAESLLEKTDLQKAYVNRLQHAYVELKYSKMLRSLLYCVDRRVPFVPIKAFTSLGGNRLVETVHGLRSFRFFRKLGNLYKKKE